MMLMVIGTQLIEYMTRRLYFSPLCDYLAAEQDSLLCDSYSTGDREIDNLTDAYNDWDFVG